jgi:hypothetical protein
LAELLLVALGLDLGVVQADPDGLVEVESFPGVRGDDGVVLDAGIVAGGDVPVGVRQWRAVRDEDAFRGVELAAAGDDVALVVDQRVVALAQAAQVFQAGGAAVGPVADVVQVLRDSQPGKRQRWASRSVTARRRAGGAVLVRRPTARIFPSASWTIVDRVALQPMYCKTAGRSAGPSSRWQRSSRAGWAAGHCACPAASAIRARVSAETRTAGPAASGASGAPSVIAAAPAWMMTW